MDKYNTRNVTVYAVNDCRNSGYDIYIAFSGRGEFLMHHRHNGLLYAILKDGIHVDDLKRINYKAMLKNVGSRQGNRQRITRLDLAIRHLRRVIDEYMMECAEYQAA